jgi:hypothetical protein
MQPCPSAPAGTFRIAADFTNSSGETILHPFAEVIELTNNDQLLNADGGSGRAGARLTFPDASFAPGVTQTIELIIGLQTHDAFNFLVNVLGNPQSPQ